MKKTKNTVIGPETLLLSNEIFKNRVTQVIASSIILVGTVGVQVYLFIMINEMLKNFLMQTA